MKVLFIINQLHTGGAEVQLFKLLDSLPKSIEPYVIALDENGKIGEKISLLGIPVFSFGMKDNSTASVYYCFFKLIRTIKPDIVHTWMYYSNLIGGIISKLAGVKHIVWSIHHNDLSPILNKRSTLLSAKFGGYFSRLIPSIIVCVSKTVLETHKSYGYNPSKMLIIGNGVSTEEFKKIENSKIRLCAELSVDQSVKFIGLFARYDPIKNIKGFLSICSRLSNYVVGDNIHIVMAGSNINSGNKELVNMIEEFGLTSKVHLLNTRADMPTLLNAMDVVVNPSFNEAFSLILAEAMACETICITTNEGDPSSIIYDPKYSAPVKDEDALAQIIVEALNMSNEVRLKLGKASREKIRQNFELEVTTGAYFDLFERVSSE